VRGRRGGGINPLWANAPFVLLRFPGLFLALLAGALLLALSTAAYPLFISSIASELVSARVADPSTTRYGAGIVYRDIALPLSGSVPGDRSMPLYQGLQDRFSGRSSENSLLGPATSSMLGPTIAVTTASRADQQFEGRIFSAQDVFAYVRKLAGEPGDGVWLADLTANDLQVTVGDTIELQFAQHPPVHVRVDGIYRSLISQPRTGYWHEWDADIYPSCPNRFECPVPPPFVVVDPNRFVTLAQTLAVHRIEFMLQAPLRPTIRPTLDQARQLVRFTGRFGSDIRDRHTEVGRVFRCCALYYAAGSSHPRAQLSSDMSLVVTDVDKRIATLQSPGRLLQLAGEIVALALLAAAGAYTLAARRTEAQLLFARGLRPGTVAARTVLESVTPCVLGGAIGLGLTFVVVRAIGPRGPIAASAARGAFLDVALAVPVALLLLSGVALGASARNPASGRGSLRRVAGMPWEFALLALAGYALRRLLTGGALVQDSALGVKRPSAFLLLFPVLAISGVAVLASRSFGAAVRWLRDRSSRYPAGLYLAVHRLAGGIRPTFLLVAAAALCLGIFVQGEVLVRSLQTTVNAKAGLFVGSDVEGKMLYETPLPGRFPLPLTRVTRVEQPGTLVPGGGDFDLLAVDPATLAGAAYWNPSFSDVSINSIARSLAGPSTDRVPVVVAGEGAPVPTGLEMEGREVPVRVVARASAFPGMSSFRPLVVVDADALLGAFEGLPNPLASPAGASTEFWVKGDTDRGVAALQGLRYPPYLVLTLDHVEEIPEIAAVIDTFIVLNALGLVAASLVLVGMLMYLQARRRSQIVSYGLSLRMGMRHAGHRRSLVTEVGMMLCYAYLIGLGIAFATVLVLVSRLDPLPTIPPSPFLVFPARLVMVILVAVLAVSWFAGWFTNRRARGIDLGTVMRLAE
jgi:putative ABC transport system permease protein